MVAEKGNKEMNFKVGDKVKVLKNIKYSFGIKLFKDSILKVISVNNDNSITCKASDTDVVCYNLLAHNVKKI